MLSADPAIAAGVKAEHLSEEQLVSTAVSRNNCRVQAADVVQVILARQQSIASSGGCCEPHSVRHPTKLLSMFFLDPQCCGTVR